MKEVGFVEYDHKTVHAYCLFREKKKKTTEKIRRCDKNDSCNAVDIDCI